MKVIPKKPHFFKPIQPGFKHGVKIPIGFLKYLKGQEKERAVLRRAGKKWKVKVNGRNLEEGWEKFAEEFDLQLGNILVFRYEGNMEFEVAIFDSSHCDAGYAEHLQEPKEEDTSNKFEFKGKDFHHIEDSTQNSIGQSHFECTIRPYCLSAGFLSLPKQFARENGLINKQCDLIIIDERQRSWNLRIYTTGRHVNVGGRWGEFCVANDLKEGGQIRFEVVMNGEKPIWTFHDKANPRSVSSSNTFYDAEASTHNPIDQSSFECTIRSYCLSNGYLRLPRQFAKENGLNNKRCDLIIIGEGRKSWNLRLYTSGSQVFVGGRWGKFCVENDLKVGDHVRFEVVANGEKPIWKVHVEKLNLRGSPSLHREVKKNNMNGKRISKKGLHFQKQMDLTIKTSDVTDPISQAPTSTSADDANPYFISTIKPYIITNSVLYLPMAFAKSNGLMNRTKMILMYEKRRWPVRLGLTGSHISIQRREWVQFMKANGIRVGDTYKFELISNGTIPMAYFHCNYSGKRMSSIKED